MFTAQYRIIIRDVEYGATENEWTIAPIDNQTADICEVGISEGHIVHWDATPETVAVDAIEFEDAEGRDDTNGFGNGVDLLKTLEKVHGEMAEAFKAPILKESDLLKAIQERRASGALTELEKRHDATH